MSRFFHKTGVRQIHLSSLYSSVHLTAPFPLGMLSAAINATTLALIHAGVSITSPLSSLSVSALHDVALLDPSATEETDLPTVTVACLSPSVQPGVTAVKEEDNEDDPLEGRVTLVNMETRLSIDRFEGMLKLAVQGCRVISDEMDKVIRAWTASMAEKVKEGPNAYVASANEATESMLHDGQMDLA
jgi:exosome complex component RRP41